MCPGIHEGAVGNYVRHRMRNVAKVEWRGPPKAIVVELWGRVLEK